MADESVVTSHGSPQIVPHVDAAPKGIAPLSINRRGTGIGGLGGGKCSWLCQKAATSY